MTGVEQSVLLASNSAGRLAMFQHAGVTVTAVPAFVDEDSIKTSLIIESARPRDIADSLAEAKAVKVSRKYLSDLVIGSDQILVCADGRLLDKPANPEQAKDHLRYLSGQTHTLISAAVVCEAGQPVWRHIDTAKMTMRVLSEDFIGWYVDRHWDIIQHCVGCYRIEAEGAQLFVSLDGSQFTVIGMPLLPLLDYLRVRGKMPS